MSRGLGKMERAVLEHVPGSPGAITSTGIAANIFGTEPTEPQLRSMRRAISSLARKGLIITWIEPCSSAVRGKVAGAYRAPDRTWRRWERDPGQRYGDRLKTVCQRTPEMTRLPGTVGRDAAVCAR